LAGRPQVLTPERWLAAALTRQSNAEIARLVHAAWVRGQHLQLLLAQLPSDQRQAIELTFFGGLTYSELAEHLS